MEALRPAMTEDMSKLMDAFGPGPLTMVVAKKDGVPDRTTGGLDTVAVRMPDSKIALDLIRESGCPIAAPSANISGRPSPTRAKDVIADMDGIIEGVICGEDCRVGIESTVLDVTGETPIILRPGIITADKIAFVLQKEVRYDEALLAGKNSGDIKPRSPGMKYKHYAPKAEMLIIEGHQQNVRQEVEKIKAEKEAQGLKVGVMMFEDDAFEEAARDFFAKLRDFDNEGADMILAGALCDSDGVGFAVMNRMLKSAGYNIIKV
jgi:L-threonylcarbamoyladenylate synthase